MMEAEVLANSFAVEDHQNHGSCDSSGCYGMSEVILRPDKASMNLLLHTDTTNMGRVRTFSTSNMDDVLNFDAEGSTLDSMLQNEEIMDQSTDSWNSTTAALVDMLCEQPPITMDNNTFNNNNKFSNTTFTTSSALHQPVMTSCLVTGNNNDNVAMDTLHKQSIITNILNNDLCSATTTRVTNSPSLSMLNSSLTSTPNCSNSRARTISNIDVLVDVDEELSQFGGGVASSDFNVLHLDDNAITDLDSFPLFNMDDDMNSLLEQFEGESQDSIKVDLSGEGSELDICGSVHKENKLGLHRALSDSQLLSSHHNTSMHHHLTSNVSPQKYSNQLTHPHQHSSPKKAGLSGLLDESPEVVKLLKQKQRPMLTFSQSANNSPAATPPSTPTTEMLQKIKNKTRSKSTAIMLPTALPNKYEGGGTTHRGTASNSKLSSSSQLPIYASRKLRRLLGHTTTEDSESENSSSGDVVSAAKTPKKSSDAMMDPKVVQIVINVDGVASTTNTHSEHCSDDVTANQTPVSSSTSGSRCTTPDIGNSKKKISLSAYKSRRAVQVAGSSSGPSPLSSGRSTPVKEFADNTQIIINTVRSRLNAQISSGSQSSSQPEKPQQPETSTKPARYSDIIMDHDYCQSPQEIYLRQPPKGRPSTKNSPKIKSPSKKPALTPEILAKAAAHHPANYPAFNPYVQQHPHMVMDSSLLRSQQYQDQHLQNPHDVKKFKLYDYNHGERAVSLTSPHKGLHQPPNHHHQSYDYQHQSAAGHHQQYQHHYQQQLLQQLNHDKLQHDKLQHDKIQHDKLQHDKAHNYRGRPPYPHYKNNPHDKYEDHRSRNSHHSSRPHHSSHHGKPSSYKEQHRLSTSSRHSSNSVHQQPGSVPLPPLLANPPVHPLKRSDRQRSTEGTFPSQPDAMTSQEQRVEPRVVSSGGEESCSSGDKMHNVTNKDSSRSESDVETFKPVPINTNNKNETFAGVSSENINDDIEQLSGLQSLNNSSDSNASHSSMLKDLLLSAELENEMKEQAILDREESMKRMNSSSGSDASTSSPCGEVIDKHLNSSGDDFGDNVGCVGDATLEDIGNIDMVVLGSSDISTVIGDQCDLNLSGIGNHGNACDNPTTTVDFHSDNHINPSSGDNNSDKTVIEQVTIAGSDNQTSSDITDDKNDDKQTSCDITDDKNNDETIASSHVETQEDETDDEVFGDTTLVNEMQEGNALENIIEEENTVESEPEEGEVDSADEEQQEVEDVQDGSNPDDINTISENINEEKIKCITDIKVEPGTSECEIYDNRDRNKGDEVEIKIEKDERDSVLSTRYSKFDSDGCESMEYRNGAGVDFADCNQCNRSDNYGGSSSGSGVRTRNMTSCHTHHSVDNTHVSNGYNNNSKQQNRRSYRKKANRSPSPESDNEPYFDKLPNYYTALSFDSKKFKENSKNNAATMRLMDNSIPTRDRDPSPDRNAPVFDKVPAYYSCFTNSTKYDSRPQGSASINTKDPLGIDFENDDGGDFESYESERLKVVARQHSLSHNSVHSSRAATPTNLIIDSHVNSRAGSISRRSSRANSRSRGNSPRSSVLRYDQRTSRSRSRSPSQRSVVSRQSRRQTPLPLNKRKRNSYSSTSRSRSRSYSRSRSGSRASSSRSRSRSRGRGRDCRSRSRYGSPYSKKRRFSRSRSRSMSWDRWRVEQTKKRELEKQSKMEERKIMYVGGIPEQYTRRDLRRKFDRFGAIEDISVHFREHGDNYGFVTFEYRCDAFAAIENGRKISGCEKMDLSFGGRRQFCKDGYADLDGNMEEDEEMSCVSSQSTGALDFDALLKQAMKKKKKS